MKGTYTILIGCKKRFRIKLGKLGFANVRKGFYIYTGSALGEGAVSLEGRLNRHFSASKKRRWHVDYLTSSQNCSVTLSIYLRSALHMECTLNEAIANAISVEPLLLHAGASDCLCPSHLTRVKSLMTIEEICRALHSVYRRHGKPVVFYGDAKRRGLVPNC